MKTSPNKESGFKVGDLVDFNFGGEVEPYVPLRGINRSTVMSYYKRLQDDPDPGTLPEYIFPEDSSKPADPATTTAYWDAPMLVLFVYVSFSSNLNWDRDNDILLLCDAKGQLWYYHSHEVTHHV